jgi:hypothetical protein
VLGCVLICAMLCLAASVFAVICSYGLYVRWWADSMYLRRLLSGCLLDCELLPVSIIRVWAACTCGSC